MNQASAKTTAMLADAVHELQCAVVPDGVIVWAGPAWKRDLGFECDDLSGLSLCDLAHSEDRERFALELIGLREQGHLTTGFECRMPTAAGETRWYRWAGVRGPEGLALSGRDVTAVREPDRGRNELIASALDAIVSINAADEIVEFNPSAERIFGFPRADVVGKSLSELIVPPGHRQAHRDGVHRVARGEPFRLLGERLELNAMRADGTEFPAELTITQTSTDPFRVTAFVRDLSEAHGAKEALRESEERYAQAFDQAPVGIALVSIDPANPGRLIRVNSALERMTGYARSDLLAGTFSDFTHRDDIAANQALFGEVVAGKRAGYEIEKRLIRQDGSVMWAQVQGTVARDGDGNALYGIGQVQDITIRKAAEQALRENENRLSRTERLARIGAWEWDAGRDAFSWSSGLDDIFGSLNPAQAPSLETFLTILKREDRGRVQRVIDDALEGKVARTWEFRVSRGGEIFHMYAWGEVVLGDDGRPAAVQGYAQDITERKRAEERAEDLRRDNKLILDAAGDGIFRVNAEGCATYVNPAAARALGYTQRELIGQQIHDLIHHSHPDGTRHDWRECPVALTVANAETHRVADDVLWRKDGTSLPVEYTSAPIEEGGATIGAVIVFSDVTERRELEARLRNFAEFDPLTGLMNRRRFEETLAEELTDRRAHGALLLLDLDHFKFVNDSFGHAAGDDLIRTIAGVLTESLRGEDVVARLGGDEFAVLLPSADPEQARRTAERLVSSIEAARPSGLQVGASVGVTCFAAGAGATAGDLLVSVDIALYEAKDLGRGRIEFFKGQPGASLTWVQRVRAALDEERFVLHAQPIVDLASGEATQQELLVRMLDENGSLVQPAEFLPTAETFRLIGEIDRWVVSQGVRYAAAGVRVHINLSGRSVGSRALLEELTTLLKESGADPSNVIFELTETVAISNLTDARSFAEGLQGLGCKLALDDFGTGFGSFTYLRNLPADYLKIDRDFVSNLQRSEADMRVVEAIVGIAERFGQRTVAEGVEDEQTLDFLRDAGVDFAQGFHLGQPAPMSLGLSTALAQP